MLKPIILPYVFFYQNNILTSLNNIGYINGIFIKIKLLNQNSIIIYIKINNIESTF